MLFSRLSSLKRHILELKIERAKVKLLEAQYKLLPHRNVPARLYRDGSRWVCVFQSHPDPMKCVIAYGDSPMQACVNFDNIWNGAGILLEEPEEEL